jgi:NAD(P)-dependent dehydrogenase (short-subunit alcohol dehydrogenase family)
VLGLVGFGDLSAYVAAKHNQVGLLQSAAKDLAERRIRVNTLHPGPRRLRSASSGIPCPLQAGYWDLPGAMLEPSATRNPQCPDAAKNDSRGMAVSSTARWFDHGRLDR